MHISTLERIIRSCTENLTQSTSTCKPRRTSAWNQNDRKRTWTSANFGSIWTSKKHNFPYSRKGWSTCLSLPHGFPSRQDKLYICSHRVLRATNVSYNLPIWKRKNLFSQQQKNSAPVKIYIGKKERHCDSSSLYPCYSVNPDMLAYFRNDQVIMQWVKVFRIGFRHIHWPRKRYRSKTLKAVHLRWKSKYADSR